MKKLFVFIIILLSFIIVDPVEAKVLGFSIKTGSDNYHTFNTNFDGRFGNFLSSDYTADYVLPELELNNLDYCFFYFDTGYPTITCSENMLYFESSNNLKTYNGSSKYAIYSYSNNEWVNSRGSGSIFTSNANGSTFIYLNMNSIVGANYVMYYPNDSIPFNDSYPVFAIFPDHENYKISLNLDTNKTFRIRILNYANIFDFEKANFVYYDYNSPNNFDISFEITYFDLVVNQNLKLQNLNEFKGTFVWDTSSFSDTSNVKGAIFTTFMKDQISFVENWGSYNVISTFSANSTGTVDIYKSYGSSILVEAYDPESDPDYPVTPDPDPDPEPDNPNQGVEDAIGDLTDDIMDPSLPDTEGYGDMAGWLPAGPLDSILTLPFTLINSISANANETCAPYKLPFLNNTFIELPCVGDYLANDSPFSSIISHFDPFIACYFLYKLLISTYKDIKRVLDMKNMDSDLGGIE